MLFSERAGEGCDPSVAGFAVACCFDPTRAEQNVSALAVERLARSIAVQ